MTDVYDNVPPSLLWPGTYFAVLSSEDRKSLRQWFSKCGPCTTSASWPGSLLEMRIGKPHRRPAKSEILVAHVLTDFLIDSHARWSRGPLNEFNIFDVLQYETHRLY